MREPPRPARPGRSRSRHPAVAATAAIVTALAAIGLQTLLAPAASADVTPSTAAAALVPLPVSATAAAGTYTLTPSSRIVATTSAATAVATSLAGNLRPATGYTLPTTTGASQPGDITLTIGDPGSLAGDPDQEGYQLAVTPTGVTITAPTTHGLFNGVQTLRQLLPAWIESPTVMAVPWTIPAQQIVDYPRYAYRGVQLDIARHYESPAQVERFIDQVSAYKINMLHLHLSDDQGFRLQINGFPNLTAIGGLTSRGTDGRAADPGGLLDAAGLQERDGLCHSALHHRRA